MPPGLTRQNSGIDAVNAAAAAAAGRRPALKIAPPDPQNTSRRVWVKRRGTTHPTSVMVEGDELVDDFKIKVLNKFPTSLLRTCDPADLAFSVPEQPPKSPGPPSSTANRRRAQSSASEWSPQLGVYIASATPTTPGVSLGTPHSAHPGHGAQAAAHASHAAHAAHGPHAHSQHAPTPVTSAPPPQASTPGSPNPRIELAPEDHIVAIVDRLWPHGMTVADAIEVYAVDAVPLGPATPSAAAALAPRPFKFRTNPPLSRPVPSRVNSEQVVPAMPPVPLQRSKSRGRSQSRPPRDPAPSMTSSTTAASTAASTPSEPKKDSGVLLLPRQFQSSDLPEQQEMPVPSPSASVPPGRDEPEQPSMTHFSPAATPTTEKVIVPQINVLIVEDNVINQKILEAFMKRKNMYYAIASNGKEAVSMWRQGGFHLILMDIQLPVMTGLEATKEIRRLEGVNRIGAFSHGKNKRAERKTPEDELEGTFKSPVIIVALTASSASKDKSEALAAGCNDFLTKPVNLLWLEQKIVEWGCMQALIDFDGWKKWIRKTSVSSE